MNETLEGQVIPTQQKVKEFKTKAELLDFLSLIQTKDILIQTFKDGRGYQLIWSRDQ